MKSIVIPILNPANSLNKSLETKLSVCSIGGQGRRQCSFSSIKRRVHIVPVNCNDKKVMMHNTCTYKYATQMKRLLGERVYSRRPFGECAGLCIDCNVAAMELESPENSVLH